MGDDKRGDNADLIQAKAARGANMIALIGVLVTAIGTVGGLAITVWMAKQDDKPQATVADQPGDQPADPAVDQPTPPEPDPKPKPPVPDKKAATPPADEAWDLGDGVKLELVLVKPGTFTMGTPNSERGRSMDEGPQHKVKMTKSYYIGKYEVTQAQYEKIVGKNPCETEGANLPVESVTWDQTEMFCGRLKRKFKKTVRLPTEAEWEYACRAGTTTATAFGKGMDPMDANFDGSQPYGPAPEGENRQKTVPVGTFPANDWGIHDMHGNVKEWTLDWYTAGTYRRKSNTDPVGPKSGSARAVRGGSWRDPGVECRSGGRGLSTPNATSPEIGFRIVVEIP